MTTPLDPTPRTKPPIATGWLLWLTWFFALVLGVGGVVASALFRRPRAGRRAGCRESGQLCAPTHWSIRERRGEGVLFRHPWVRYRRASRPARRRHVGCWARDGASSNAEL